jgi:UDP-glucose 4-epimerase
MVVVTGASGFIGRAVVAELAARGEPVVAASRRPVADKTPAHALQIKDYAELEPPAAGAILVHLAEPRDIAAVELAAESDEAQSRAVLTELLAKAWGHVVYISSAAVYGDQGEWARRPDDPVDPRGRYASAKVAAERDVLARGGAVVRLANVYGPGMAANNVMSEILAKIPRTGPLAVRDTAPVRDYLWIEDVARGIAEVAVKRVAGIVNLGTGRGTSVGELAQMALDAAGEGARPVVATAPAAAASVIVLDIARTTELLGWRPVVTLEKGLKSLLASR